MDSEGLGVLVRGRTSRQCIRYTHSFDARDCFPSWQLLDGKHGAFRLGKSATPTPYEALMNAGSLCAHAQGLPLSDQISWAARKFSIMQISLLFHRYPAPFLSSRSLKPVGRLQMEVGAIPMICMQRPRSNSTLND